MCPSSISGFSLSGILSSCSLPWSDLCFFLLFRASFIMFFYMREQFSQEEKHLTELKQPCSHLSSPSSSFIYWKPQRFIVFHFKYSLYVPKPSSESKFRKWAFCSVLAIWSWWWLTPLSFVLCFGRRESLGMTLRSICTSEQATFPPCGSKFPSHNWVFMRHHMFGRGPWRPSA